jgi:hypothetical protein
MFAALGAGCLDLRRRRAGSKRSNVAANGRRTRLKKEKTLGPASMPKHEAQAKLAEYIEEYTGRITRLGDSIGTFADLWKAFSAVKSGQWSKKTRGDLR